MGIQFSATTDVGRVRKVNEDNFLVDKRIRLFVVCDGMGGHAAGEVASAMSVQAVRDVVLSGRGIVEHVNKHDHDTTARAQLCELLERAVQTASSKVFEAATEDEAKRGMGTTCSVLLLTESRGFIAHVGDSRVYRVRQGSLAQLTEDHSLYNEMVRLGKIKPGEHDKLPNRNAVTRAVGIHDTVEVDLHDFAVQAGDRFLLCSDGLCGYFKDDAHTKSMLQGKNLTTITNRCIGYALDSGGKDNITVIVVDMVADAAEVHSGEINVGQKARQLLANSPYFAHFNAREIESIVTSGHYQRCSSDSVYRQRPESIGLGLVLSGTLDAEHEGEGRYEQGDLVGVLAFIDGKSDPRVGWRVVSSGSAEILEIPRRHLMSLMRQDAKLAMKWMWNFLQHFSHNLRQSSDVSDRKLNAQSRKVPPKLPPTPSETKPLLPASPHAKTQVRTKPKPKTTSKPAMLAEQSDPHLTTEMNRVSRTISVPASSEPAHNTDDLRRTTEFSRHLESMTQDDDSEHPDVLFSPGGTGHLNRPSSSPKIKGVPPANPANMADDMSSTVRLDPSQMGLKPSFRKKSDSSGD